MANPSGIEKIDTGDDGIEVIKVPKQQLLNYSSPDLKPDEQSKVRQLFKEAEEMKSGVECLYRKVLSLALDHPETATFQKVPIDTQVEDLYKQIKEKEGEFKGPEEGVQLVKTIGYIDPKEINKHVTNAKRLYSKKNDQGLSSGTTVQYVKVSRPNKEGKKVPHQFIKAVKGLPKPGEKPIQYYRIPDKTDLKAMLENIQLKGYPEGKEGVDYITITDEKELEDVIKLFKGNENDPQTYFYTSVVKGDGKPYGNGRIHSVTILSDPTNRLNKTNKIKQIFLKAEEANDKRIKDTSNYYYTKPITDKNKDLKTTPTTRETTIKEIFNNVKGDMTNKPDDDEYVFLIKTKEGKDVKDALNRIKNSGVLTSKKDTPEEIDMNLNKIKANTKILDVFNEVKKPNGALMIKAPKNTDHDDIINQIKNSGVLATKPEDEETSEEVQEVPKEKLKGIKKDKEQEKEKDKDKDKDIPKPVSKAPAKTTKKPAVPIDNKPKPVEGNDDLYYVILLRDLIKKYDNPEKLDELFKSAKKKEEPKGKEKEKDKPKGKEKEKPLYYYRTISRPPSEKDSQLNNTPEDKAIDELFTDAKNAGLMKDKFGEGVQIFKVIGPVESDDFTKHIRESEALYKKPGDEEQGQLQVRSIKLYPNGKKDDKEAIVYLKVTGGYKPDVYYKTIGDTDLNLVLQQIQEKGVPEKDGKPFEVVSGDELETVKSYFKPKEGEGDSKKPKGDDEDIKTPKTYFYTTKVKNKDNENTPSFIHSVTILSDPDNNLNSGKKVKTVFDDDKYKGVKPKYYYTSYDSKTENDENMELQQTDEKEIVNLIKLKKPDYGLQIVKCLGDVTTNDMAKHLRQARKNAKPVNGEPPTTYYYKTTVYGEGENEPAEGGSKRKGKVDSVTIKKDQDNSMHKGKDVETVFKEGEEEEDAGNEFTEVIYYFIKIKGGVPYNPDNVQLVKITGNKKMDDIYEEVKKLGPLEENDGIQLFKVSGEVKNEHLLSHVKEAQELYNNPEEDKKSNDPTTSYYTTEVMGKSPKKASGKERGTLQSITIPLNDYLKKLKITILQLFKGEDGSGEDDEKEKGKEKDKKPSELVRYYIKPVGGSENNPKVQLVKIGNNTNMDDLVKDGNENIVIIQAPEDLSPSEITDQLKKSGTLSTVYQKPAQKLEPEKQAQANVKVKEPEKVLIESLKERKKAIQYSKISANQLQGLSDPDLEQRYKVDDMFDPIDEAEGVVEDPNPIYYYTNVISDEKENEKADPKLHKINGDLDMGEIYRKVNGGKQGPDQGALLVKSPHIARYQELIDQIKQDELNVIKPGDEEGDEITTAIYYITEQLRNKPKEVNKLLEGNIPLKLYLFAKSKEAEGEDKSATSSGENEAAPEDNEAADNKLPDEMVRDIMKFSLGTIDQISVAPDSNEFLAKKTSFVDTLIKTLQNDINDKKYLLTGLHSLGNYLFNENGPNYSKLDLPKIYELLHDIQSKYYSWFSC